MSKKHQRISAPPCHGFADLEETQFDTDRERRCGFPEVVYAEGKTAEMLLKIFHLMRAHGIAGLATRVAPEKAERLRAEFPEGRYNETARTFRLPETKSQGNRDQKHQGRGNKGKSTKRVGKVAVITAGTSDLPVAEEARETALWTGADVVFIQDVGVAGPHRLQAKLSLLEEADVVVVVAGMEGALPSVVGGYVSVPVIAVPTSVGYGAGFGGIAALLGMLNSCAANVLVVNIDAGFKAGYAAGLIARRTSKNPASEPRP